ncbi:MAG: DUF1413 domain-containing protein [Eubacteriales bacterium]
MFKKIFYFSLNDEYYIKLETAAENKGMTIQDYIRYKLFNQNTIFTVAEAVRRVQTGSFKNKTFSLPDLYGNEWILDRGRAGVFGKNFFNHIVKHPELGIRFIPNHTIKRRAVYSYMKED